MDPCEAEGGFLLIFQHLLKWTLELCTPLGKNHNDSLYEKIINPLFLHDFSFPCVERMHFFSYSITVAAYLERYFTKKKVISNWDSFFYPHVARMSRVNQFQNVASFLPLEPAGISYIVFQHTIMKLQFAESEMLLYISHAPE